MDFNQLADGLIQYLMLVGLLTFHEFGHAWTALKCGDDTAKVMGRVSLNPFVHIDPVGTVFMPLLMLFLPLLGGGTGATLSHFMVGWAKPVPVNPQNLRNKGFDDILVTMAGPGMNLLLAIGLVALAKAGMVFHCSSLIDLGLQAAWLSLLLCFFNLIPIPPLDGSKVLRVVTGMSWETYAQFSQFGVFGVIIIMQIPQIRQLIATANLNTLQVLCRIFGVPLF